MQASKQRLDADRLSSNLLQKPADAWICIQGQSLPNTARLRQPTAGCFNGQEQSRRQSTAGCLDGQARARVQAFAVHAGQKAMPRHWLLVERTAAKACDFMEGPRNNNAG